jgi:hypothetical protein
MINTSFVCPFAEVTKVSKNAFAADLEDACPDEYYRLLPRSFSCLSTFTDFSRCLTI